MLGKTISHYRIVEELGAGTGPDHHQGIGERQQLALSARLGNSRRFAAPATPPRVVACSADATPWAEIL
jgi:hypothetical protein